MPRRLCSSSDERIREMTHDEQLSVLATPKDAHTQLVYLANFHNGSYDPSVDKLGFGALKEGSAQPGNQYAKWTPENGAVKLEVVKPNAASDLVSAGLFVTGNNLDFGPGSILDIEGTFITPRGPQQDGVL